MKLAGTILCVFLLVFLTACNANNEENKASSEQATVVSETEAGNFIIRLVADNAVYKEDENIKVEAKIKYVGEKEEIDIYYAKSPLWFQIRETTRGVDIPYEMENTLMKTTLERNKWHKEVFQYNEKNEEEYEDDFVKAFYEKESFPKGEYEIELYSDFYTREDNGEKQEHKYYTSIIIEVN